MTIEATAFDFYLTHDGLGMYINGAPGSTIDVPMTRRTARDLSRLLDTYSRM